jgi:aryl-alcohol dehydrogenase-like predicted oxidoreductase
MQKHKLGKSNISISNLCLGCMTLSNQRDNSNTLKLLDNALASGIFFFDTAEMYPIPIQESTYGSSEELIGKWLRTRGIRSEITLATKASGPAAFVPWVRSGKSRHNRANLITAVESSLKRLQTDYIDIFQLHWPDRATNFFNVRGFKAPKKDLTFDIEDTVDVLIDLVASGKIRSFGICNETAWGAMTFINNVEIKNSSVTPAIQNPYNLLNRNLEVGLSEIITRENITFFAHSPLASGILTGKYFDGSALPSSRLNLSRHDNMLKSPMILKAAKRYIAIAKKYEIDPTQMALAWLLSQPVVTSVIIGVTNGSQLAQNLSSCDITLTREILKEIDSVQQEIPNPCP